MMTKVMFLVCCLQLGIECYLLNTGNQQSLHLALICTAWTMFFGAGDLQKPLLPDGVTVEPHRNGTSPNTWGQTLE